MTKVVSPYQASFVPGRNIQDNIIIAKEVSHMMHKMNGKKGYMTIKIDLEKAYDRLNLEFLLKVLEELKIPEGVVNIIRSCLYSVKMRLLWNGSRKEEFKPTRGIRQGDPLSPYLFILAMEKLSHIIADSVDTKQWKPIKIGRNQVSISHLLFADDLLLFCEASVEQMTNALECLDLFGTVSGQKVNPSKTSIFFSKNVARDEQNVICNMSGFQRKEDLGRYLGAHITHGRNSRAKFQYLIDKVQKKLSGWKSQSLSLAGRLTLVQSVTSQIANFQMQHEHIPPGVCYEIEKLQRNFVWGSNQDKQKLHAVNWEGVCRPKEEGGVGIRRMREMNEALMGKIGWNMLAKPEGLCTRVLKAKYGRGADLFTECRVKNHDSLLWKKLAKVLPDITKEVGWEVRNGKYVKFWMDKWLGGNWRLAEYCVDSEVAIDEDLRVQHVVGRDGNWDWSWLERKIPGNVMQLIKAIPPPCREDGDDRVVWRGGNGGDFSVAQLYNRRRGNVNEAREDIWKYVWQVKTTKRIQVFLWLADRTAY